METKTSLLFHLLQQTRLPEPWQVEDLLEDEDVDENALYTDEEGHEHTLLSLVCLRKYGDAEETQRGKAILTLLLQTHEVDIEYIRDGDEETLLVLAIKDNTVPSWVVEKLLKFGADVHVKTCDEQSLLEWFIETGENSPLEGDMEKKLDIVLQHPDVDVNEKVDESGDTLLCMAVERDKLQMVKKLADRGADVNAKGVDEMSPLELALRRNSVCLVEYFLEHSAIKVSDKLQEIISSEQSANLVAQHILRLKAEKLARRIDPVETYVRLELDLELPVTDQSTAFMLKQLLHADVPARDTGFPLQRFLRTMFYDGHKDRMEFATAALEEIHVFQYDVLPRLRRFYKDIRDGRSCLTALWGPSAESEAQEDLLDFTARRIVRETFFDGVGSELLLDRVLNVSRLVKRDLFSLPRSELEWTGKADEITTFGNNLRADTKNFQLVLETNSFDEDALQIVLTESSGVSSSCRGSSKTWDRYQELLQKISLRYQALRELREKAQYELRKPVVSANALMGVQKAFRTRAENDQDVGWLALPIYIEITEKLWDIVSPCLSVTKKRKIDDRSENHMNIHCMCMCMCKERPSDVTFLPCGHQARCLECIKRMEGVNFQELQQKHFLQVRDQEVHCPLCGQTAAMLVHSLTSSTSE